MCGIIGIIAKKNITKEQYAAFVEAWTRASDRGRDACGYVATTGKYIHWWKYNVPSTEGRERMLRDTPWNPNMKILLGHTRYATSGSPEDNINNHPLIIGGEQDGKSLWGIHNGVITNKDELLDSKGWQAQRGVDTEIAFRLISHYGAESVQPFELMRGSFNLAYLSRADTRSFYLARKGNPLMIKKGRDFTAFGSLSHYWAGLEGREDEVEDNTVSHIFQNKITRKRFKPCDNFYSWTPRQTRQRGDSPLELSWDRSQKRWAEMDVDAEDRYYQGRDGVERVIDPETGMLERKRDIWPH